MLLEFICQFVKHVDRFFEQCLAHRREKFLSHPPTRKNCDLRMNGSAGCTAGGGGGAGCTASPFVSLLTRCANVHVTHAQKPIDTHVEKRTFMSVDVRCLS